VTDPHTPDNRILRLNIGFILKEGAGYSRDVTFEVPGITRARDIDLITLTGVVHLTRTPQGVLVQGDLQAGIQAECTRCLEEMVSIVTIEFSELFTPHTAEGDPETTINEGGFIDLSPIVRDEAILAQTMQLLCKPDCKGLCAHCGQNLNEGSCDCEDTDIDPRFEALRALLDQK
jgi:uncharacterized protein